MVLGYSNWEAVIFITFHLNISISTVLSILCFSVFLIWTQQGLFRFFNMNTAGAFSSFSLWTQQGLHPSPVSYEHSRGHFVTCCISTQQGLNPFLLYEHSRAYIRFLLYQHSRGLFVPVAYEHGRATLEIVAMLHHAAIWF